MQRSSRSCSAVAMLSSFSGGAGAEGATEDGPPEWSGGGLAIATDVAAGSRRESGRDW
jgi:hypothetical protein